MQRGSIRPAGRSPPAAPHQIQPKAQRRAGQGGAEGDLQGDGQALRDQLPAAFPQQGLFQPLGQAGKRPAGRLRRDVEAQVPGPAEQHDGAGVVGGGKVHHRPPLLGDGEAAGRHVGPAALHHVEQGGGVALEQLHPHVQRVGDPEQQLHLKAGGSAVGRQIVQRLGPGVVSKAQGAPGPALQPVGVPVDGGRAAREPLFLQLSQNAAGPQLLDRPGERPGQRAAFGQHIAAVGPAHLLRENGQLRLFCGRQDGRGPVEGRRVDLPFAQRRQQGGAVPIAMVGHILQHPVEDVVHRRAGRQPQGRAVEIGDLAVPRTLPSGGAGGQDQQRQRGQQQKDSSPSFPLAVGHIAFLLS